MSEPDSVGRVKRTSDEWVAELFSKESRILDPDGWDRKRLEQSWNEPITRMEFVRRCSLSTGCWSRETFKNLQLLEHRVYQWGEENNE